MPRRVARLRSGACPEGGTATIAGREGGPGPDIHRETAGHERELLRLIGIDPAPERGGRHRRCPFPGHDDADPSWRWDAAKRRWFCSCAEKGGTAINAVMG